MRKVYLLLLLVALLGGCVRQGKPVRISATEGLVINEFSSDLKRYERTEPINLYLEVENVGGTTASNVKLSILGATWDSTPCPQDASCPVELAAELSPPDISVTPPVPGDFVSKSWALEPYEGLPEGVEADVTLIARVEYDYASNGVVTIPVLSKEEYKSRIQRGVAVPKAPNVTNSAGPIHIGIDPRGLPIVIKEAGEEFSLRIYFQNVGSGVPITGGEIGKMMINLSLAGLDAEFTNCGGKSGKEVELEVKLRRGESVTIPCVVKIKQVPEHYGYFSTIFKSSYRYYVEKPLTITIVGTS